MWPAVEQAVDAGGGTARPPRCVSSASLIAAFVSLPMILIQEIRGIWSKASRGGAAAALRNSVPEAALFPISRSKSTAHKIFHQLLVYGEANDFTEPLKAEIVELESDSISVGCVKISAPSEQLVVAYEYDYGCGGLPPRLRRPGINLREELIVGRESWVRVKYNGRFSGDEWWYEKVVVNVGLFQNPDAGLFGSTKPAGEISQMAALR